MLLFVLSVLIFWNSGREVFIKKSSFVALYSCSAFLRAALERASNDQMVLLNCFWSIECLLFGSLFLRKEGISCVGLYLDKSGLVFIGGLIDFGG